MEDNQLRLGKIMRETEVAVVDEGRGEEGEERDEAEEHEDDGGKGGAAEPG